eukprot:COSAG01_NODE_5974_length_3920_cov_2.667800_6_plen_167_part_00
MLGWCSIRSVMWLCVRQHRSNNFVLRYDAQLHAVEFQCFSAHAPAGDRYIRPATWARPPPAAAAAAAVAPVRPEEGEPPVHSASASSSSSSRSRGRKCGGVPAKQNEPTSTRTQAQAGVAAAPAELQGMLPDEALACIELDAEVLARQRRRQPLLQLRQMLQAQAA